MITTGVLIVLIGALLYECKRLYDQANEANEYDPEREEWR